MRKRKYENGRSPESIEKRKEHQRETFRQRYQSDNEFRLQYLAKQKSRRNKDLTKAREKDRARYYRDRDSEIKRRVEWSKNNREQQRQTYREWYARNKERNRKTIYAARKRREPWRGLYQCELDYRNGRITFNEFARQYGDALIRLDERLKPKSTGN